MNDDVDDHSPTIPDLRRFPRELAHREPLLPISYRVIYTPPPPHESKPPVKIRADAAWSWVVGMLTCVVGMFTAMAIGLTVGTLVCCAAGIGVFLLSTRFLP